MTPAAWASRVSLVTKKWDGADSHDTPALPEPHFHPGVLGFTREWRLTCSLVSLILVYREALTRTRTAGDEAVRLGPSCPIAGPSITPLASPVRGRLLQRCCQQGQGVPGDTLLGGMMVGVGMEVGVAENRMKQTVPGARFSHASPSESTEGLPQVRHKFSPTINPFQDGRSNPFRQSHGGGEGGGGPTQSLGLTSRRK